MIGSAKSRFVRLRFVIDKNFVLFSSKLTCLSKMGSKLFIDEKDMLLALREGRQEALNALMEAYKRPLAKRVMRLIKSREDTEEILQELFVRVWTNREGIDPEQSIKAYLFRITENLVFDMIRKTNRQKRLFTMYRSMHLEAYDHVEEELYQKENRLLLYRLLEQLPEQTRRVFILCKFEGRSYSEVGKLLSISTATVNSHITKANRFLKKYVKNNSLTMVVCLSLIFCL